MSNRYLCWFCVFSTVNINLACVIYKNGQCQFGAFAFEPASYTVGAVCGLTGPRSQVTLPENQEKHMGAAREGAAS